MWSTRYGNLISSGSGSTANVTLAIASGPGGKLLGTTTVAAVGGAATFSTLSIHQVGSYTLTASGVWPGRRRHLQPVHRHDRAGHATGVHDPARQRAGSRTMKPRGGDRGRPVRQHGDHATAPA